MAGGGASTGGVPATATASFWKAIDDKDGAAAAAVVADHQSLHWCASREGASTLHWAASSGCNGAMAALIGAGAAAHDPPLAEKA
ncbi:hypothetical protein BU14_0187s0014 [Porphyra umbilicalis]|uniref:Uncharacterized protein n=1 Tax=Porphyra umbilicalis TaxID=2786 RepID=A0A1X6P702_PORUM|nr:hypothetical protein BU14_0187s0014 [Porphyra umbilicalis]|eukprot:OSX76535.1 hypothetical protein BU14_0187s0014 [Porphyra umbilicalis]